MSRPDHLGDSPEEFWRTSAEHRDERALRGDRVNPLLAEEAGEPADRRRVTDTVLMVRRGGES